jgi:hypothetical protein
MPTVRSAGILPAYGIRTPKAGKMPALRPGRYEISGFSDLLAQGKPLKWLKAFGFVEHPAKAVC